MKKTLMGLAMLLVTAVNGAAAQGHEPGCPNKKATNVDAKIDDKGSTKTCGIGIVVFGVGGGIFGPKCPPIRFTYPAHGECKGEPGDHMRCVPDGDLQVKKEKCECRGLVVPILQVGVPTSCSCSDAGDGGKVLNYKSELCPGV